MSREQTAWTSEELELLRENYPKYGTGGDWMLGLKPEHQKPGTIQGAAAYRKIRCEGRRWEPWTTRELQLLRENYPYYGLYGSWVQQLKPEHRRRRAIEAQAGQQGLRRSKGWKLRDNTRRMLEEVARKRVEPKSSLIEALKNDLRAGLTAEEIAHKYHMSDAMCAVLRARIAAWKGQAS